LTITAEIGKCKGKKERKGKEQDETGSVQDRFELK
jgi:hypothetical protein